MAFEEMSPDEAQVYALADQMLKAIKGEKHEDGQLFKAFCMLFYTVVSQYPETLDSALIHLEATVEWFKTFQMADQDKAEIMRQFMSTGGASDAIN